MRLVSSWIREFVEIPGDDRKLAADLTMAGIFFESREPPVGEFDFDDLKKNFGGKGSLELAGGRVAGLPLLAELVKWSRISYYEPLQVSKLWATADANAGVVRTADFKIENPDMTVEAAGEVDLEKKLNFVVKTTFEKKAAERLAREGKALALVRDDDGRAHFNFVVTGEAAKPAFQLEASSMLGAAGVPAPGAGTAETGVEGDIF